MTLSEAAEILDLQPRFIRHLVELGEIPARTHLALTFISLADLDVYRLRTRLAVNSAAPRASDAPDRPPTLAGTAGTVRGDYGAAEVGSAAR
jgi:hypothetical protein